MATYRQSRNIEATIVQYLEDKANDPNTGWSNLNIVKTYSKVYSEDYDVPIILVRLGDSEHLKVQIGSTATKRGVEIFLIVHASSDGQKLDLKDWLISVIRNGCEYYEYETKREGRKTVIKSKTKNGWLHVDSITDTEVDMGISKNLLDVKDRYKHQISLIVSRRRVEK